MQIARCGFRVVVTFNVTFVCNICDLDVLWWHKVAASGVWRSLRCCWRWLMQIVMSGFRGLLCCYVMLLFW
jgi:hypothetical protein